MSSKNVDQKGRWRTRTVGFRVSEEENLLLNRLVELSGLNKQDYLISRVLNRDVKVYANPRVYKALKESIHMLIERLEGLDTAGLDPETALYIKDVFTIYAQLRENASEEAGKDE